MSTLNSKNIILYTLGIVALAVVFLLPQFVSEPLIKAPTEMEIHAPPPTDVAPSRVAEKKQFREQAQAVLAEVFALKNAVENLNVRSWNEDGFDAVLKQIESGDALYSRGDYDLALQQYTNAREGLQALQSESEALYNSVLNNAEIAIENAQIDAAARSVELLNLLKPAEPTVVQFTQRLQTLPQLKPQLDEGKQRYDAGDFVAAEQALAQAVTIDPHHKEAARLLEAVRSEKQQRAFNQQMGLGFAAMEQGNFVSARQHFEGARQLDPANAAVSQALSQLGNNQSRNTVDVQLDEARAMEAAENWQQALDIYQALVAQDATLNEPRARLIPARVRAELDTRLEGLIADPLALSSEANTARARQALDDARGIGNPGSKLSTQVSQLAALLEQSRTPVDVQFSSDNQTQVTLYRVGNLGAFDTRVMQLKPGKYIVAGARKGYRDVRVEFTVSGQSPDSPIVVRCTETI